MDTINGVRILRVVDADTIKILIPTGTVCGVDQYSGCSCRLHGIDAPESSTAAGRLVTKIIQRLYPHWMEATLEIVGDDKYQGRLSGNLTVKETNIGEWLKEQNLVKEYYGGTRRWTIPELNQVEQKAKLFLSQVSWIDPYQ